MDYEPIVIGGGTGGINAAKAARRLGAKLPSSSKESFAGTCPLRG